MKSYGKWRATVYDVIFGELKFLDSHSTLLCKLYRKPNLVELAVNDHCRNCLVTMIWRVTVNSHSPFFRVAKLWRV